MGKIAKQFDMCVGRDYESRGETKTAWTNIGKLFVNDDGSVWGRVTAVPVGWDGKFSAFPPRDRQQTPQPQQQAPQPQPIYEPESGNYERDDLPF